MKIIQIILLSILSFSCLGQVNYVPVMSSDPLPENIQDKLADQLESSLQESDAESISRTSDRKEFLIKTNYSINQILRSGQVIFNDEITNYLESVKDVIYQYNPDLPEEIVIYTLRSTRANAFSTSEGVVVVTTGLLAQLETEAQLAFVLCHEISHYVKQHVVEGYIENKVNSKDRYQNRNDYEKYVAVMSKFSKNHEFEADSEGADYFLKTPYVSSESYTAFDVLHYSYLPFDEVEFDYEIFENEYFHVEEHMKLEEVTPIDVFNEDYDDSESNHPNIWKRKKKIKDILESQKDAGSDLFISGEELFLNVQLLSRKENIRLNLMQHQYIEAIYSSFLMIQEDSLDVFSQVSIAKAFYGIQQYNSFNELNELVLDHEYVEGESSKLHYFFDQLTDEEINVLAIQQLHKVYKLDPENAYFKDLIEDLMYDMVWEERINLDDFEVSKPELVIAYDEDSMAVDTIKAETFLVIEETGRGSKYDKIEKLKEEGDKGDEDSEVGGKRMSNYHLGLIGVFKESPELLTFLEELTEEFDDKNKTRSTGEDRYLDPYEDRKRIKKINKHGASLGLDNFVVYNPRSISFNPKGEIQYLKSEDKKISYTEYIQDYTLQTGTDSEVLSFLNSEEVLAEDYNKMSFLSAWSFEADLHHSNDVDMIPSESEYSYAELFNCDQDYLVFTNIYYFPEKREIGASAWLYSALLYPTLPFTIAAAVTKKKHNYHFLAVYDLKSGALIHSNLRDLKIKQPDLVIKGMAYDAVNQLIRN